MTIPISGLPARIARRIGREATWYFKYRWNPFNPFQIGSDFCQNVSGVRSALNARGVAFEPLQVSLTGFADFLERCGYPATYFGGAGTVYTEKTLEHYLSLELMGMDGRDTYIDLASDRSPFPSFVRDAIGCRVYVNDLSYPPGITDGWRIGSDATQLPLPSDAISRATLHCSFEHFEGDSDMRLMRELARVLRSGGKVCIVPLYLHTHYLGMTDPTVDRAGLEWDSAMATILCKGYGERHGRFYDVAKLQERIYSQLGPLKPRLYNVENLDEVAKGLWCHWILLLEKEG